MAFFKSKRKTVPTVEEVVWEGDSVEAYRDPAWTQLDTSDSRRLISEAWDLLETETNPLNRHFIYNLLEVALYKSREDFVEALSEYDRAGEAHDAEMETIRPVLLTEFDGKLPGLPTYRQQAIRQAKALCFSRLLWWAQRGIELYADDALDSGNVEDLERRVRPAEKELATEQRDA
jgi:hypothetical protein